MHKSSGKGSACAKAAVFVLLLATLSVLAGCMSGLDHPLGPVVRDGTDTTVGTDSPDATDSSALAALSDQVAQLSRQLQQLEETSGRSALAGRALLPTSVNLLNRTVDVAGLPGRGAPTAPVAIIEITDYQCPFCRTHFQETWRDIEAQLVEPGLVRYYVLDYPLPGHELAPLAAVSAGCAGRQDRFWEFHDSLFGLSGLQDASDIDAIAIALGLDLARFGACREEHGQQARLDELGSLAMGLGVHGTPTFFFGRLGENGRVADLTELQGLHPVEDFSARVARYIEGG